MTIIVGLIHQKDFYSLPEGEPWRLKERMTRPAFVWENEKIHGLLHRLQRARSHVAVAAGRIRGNAGNRDHGRYSGGAGRGDLG